MLESATDSYKFLPRTTVEKVFVEFRRSSFSSSVTKARLRKWFQARVPELGLEGPSRWKERRVKLEEVENNPDDGMVSRHPGIQLLLITI